MMHVRWAVPVMLAVGVACASTPATPPTDAGSDGDADPCAGLGCPVSLPSLTVTVLGAGGAPVPNPYFSEGAGKQLPFQCVLVQDADAGGGDAGDAGSGSVCAKWKMVFSVGKHVIAIDAQGYVSQEIDVDLKGPPACCAQADQLEKTVTLASQ